MKLRGKGWSTLSPITSSMAGAGDCDPVVAYAQHKGRFDIWT
jgi:hypothetical protein